MGLRYFRKEKQYLEMTDFGNMPNSIEYSGNVYKFIFKHFEFKIWDHCGISLIERFDIIAVITTGAMISQL